MRKRGRLTEWNDDRGFGFVTSIDDQSRAFVHISAFPNVMRRPIVLDLITYETVADDRGRPQATSVEFLAPVAQKYVRSGGRQAVELPAFLPLGLLAAGLVAAAVVDIRLSVWASGGYALLSAITFLAYAADKSAAQAGRFRTQESALHLLDIAGGWPGGLIAQRLLRHKTTKKSFQLAFWMCVVVNLVILVTFIGLRAASPG
jgi:uncharacterized membrane protein YsdA (DUF1294 family)/cold shock CspA family protein